MGLLIFMNSTSEISSDHKHRKNKLALSCCTGLDIGTDKNSQSEMICSSWKMIARSGRHPVGSV